ncbi:MAG TPA: tyrosine--tRNA ligase [Ginsengibacter sp.]|nr:tyrosine--tRNA ligase [Ginsengibacter sp.]HRP17181.1 tyrosine--tRNA ligase [Ginsengibacter sp.]HRP43865.1 tyrosine--tRNA ligase [Ginsengibacter sp.]
MKNVIEELRWRGLLHDMIPGTEEQLLKESTAGYVGFDPTAESLHIGSLVPILVMVHLQRFGHKPVALIGGATGMVGDPTGKSEERNLLDRDTLDRNMAGIRKQLSKFIDFDSNQPNNAVMVNNYDWFREISFLDFIRDTGKHITVNYMMAKDSVKKRLESDNGMSFTEFCYQLMQGYDFYRLYHEQNCKLQFGGSDQWGNIVTGVELLRRKSGKEAFAFTSPLIKKADGNKFGKSEKGNVWIDAERTSPYSFYQFWLNTADEDAERFLKIFTFLTREEITDLAVRHKGNEHQRILQNKLAEEVTRFVHSQEDLDFAIEASRILFGNDTENALRSLTEKQFLQIMEGVPQFGVSRSQLAEQDLTSLLVYGEVFKSKGEARKMITAGGVSLNKTKVLDEGMKIDSSLLLSNKYLLIQKGKKNYFLLTVN